MSNGMEIVLRIAGAPAQRPAGPGAGELEVHLPDSRQVALEVYSRGIANMPRAPGGEIRRVVMDAPAIPTLDEMLGASFAKWLAEGSGEGGGGEGSLPAAAEAFARYAALARAGYSPGRIAPEFSMEGIYQALCWPFGTHLADEAAAARFVGQWNRMAAVIKRAIDEGVDPFTEQLFSESKGFAQEIISLRSDRQVYTQDVKAGMRLKIHLPDETRGPAGEAGSSALILRNPRSLLFKQWARADAGSPTGDGYQVLGVEWDAGEWVFSTDPVQRISLKALAEELTAREKKKGGGAVWFDGAPFQYSLIGAPKSGSRLTADEVLKTFSSWSHAQLGHAPVSQAPHAGRRLGPIAMAACLLVLMAALGWWGFGKWMGKPQQVDPSLAATELDELHVRPLKSVKGAVTSSNEGLFVGVNDFRPGEFPHLDFAVDDAIALAHLFVVELQLIPPENAVLAIQGEPGTMRGRKLLQELLANNVRPTEASRSDVISGLDRLERIPEPGAAAKPDGLLVTFFSTHGLENSEGEYIMLHDGMTSHPSEGAISVAELNRSMKLINVSKRILIVDACRVAPKAGSKAPPQRMSEGFLAALRGATGQELMTACGPGEASYEYPAKGHGIFTYWLLMALKGGSTGAPADGRGLITIGTMEAYLQAKVSRDSRLHALGVQNPQFSADGDAQDIPLAVPESP